ncbi:MAG: hypothetical protein EBS07_10885 [Sphingobacteriia bacterium]|nr:hypothetical protein [Sphingobacteriia bacterium]
MSQVYSDALITAGGLKDASILLEAWARPLGSSIGSGMCNGWYSTARVHKFPGGSISFLLSTPRAPQSEKTFDVADLNFSNYRISPGQSSTISQTILGENTSGPQLVTLGDDPFIPGLDSNLVLNRFNTPGGLGRAPSVPGLQLAFGLPSNTEIILRYFPYPNSQGDFRNSLWGFGLKHNLNQWIPALKSRLLDISILTAFSSFSVKAPITISVDPAYTIVTGSTDFSNQNFFYGVKAFTTQLTASKEFMFFTPYFSLGYNHIDSRLKLSGNYPIYQDITRTGPDAGKGIYQTINNPLDINFKANNALRSSLGFRVRFIKVCTFFMEYTLARYRVLTFGIGLTYR